MYYQDKIAEELAKLGAVGVDPRHVEGYMLIENPTLDGLTPDQFAFEVELCAACVAEVGKVEAEALAASFGL